MLENDTLASFRAFAGEDRLPSAPRNPPPPSDRRHKSFEAACYKSLYLARTPQDFADQISDILGNLRFSAYSFIGLTPAPRFLFDTLPDALMRAYGQEKFTGDDYALCYGRSASAPTLRSTIEDYMAAAPVETRDMARNRELSALFKSHGFYDFYLIPLSSGRNRYLFSVTTEDIGPDFYKKITRYRRSLSLLAEIMLTFGQRKFPGHFAGAAAKEDFVMNSQPQTVLTLLAKEDIALPQVAEKLDRSIHTINQQIAAARKALGTRTTHTAIYRAIQQGFIPCPCKDCTEDRP